MALAPIPAIVQMANERIGGIPGGYCWPFNAGCCGRRKNVVSRTSLLALNR